MSHLKGAVACKTAIGCDNMEVRIEILKIAEGLDSDHRIEISAVIDQGMFQIDAQNFPGTAGKFGKQFSIVHEIDSKSLGNAEHPLPVGDSAENLCA